MIRTKSTLMHRTRILPSRAALPAAAATAVLLLVLPSIALASSRYAPASSPYAPEKVVVGYRTVSRSSLLARSASVKGPHRLDQVRVRVVEETKVLTLRHGVSVAAALRRLRKRGDVAWAVPDYVAHAATIEPARKGGASGSGEGEPSEGGPTEAEPTQGEPSEGESPSGAPPPAEYVPNDPGSLGGAGDWRALQWNFVGPFGVNAPQAWANLIADRKPGGEGVTVAVLDTGVAYATRGGFLRSPDFDQQQFVKGYDFVKRDAFPYDRNGHGTFVAGTIAEATNNGKDLTGLAYGVRLMPVRVLNASGEGDASTIAKGIRFAVRHHAQVINMSLEFSSGVSAADVPELVSAIAYAHRHHVVLVAAAGNEYSTNIPEPARDRYVIAVGASTEHGCLAEYSNYGHGVALVAPGGGADANLPGDPNCRPHGTPGKDVYQETFKGSSPRVFGMPSGYEGTSMAAPHVSATAALVIASGVLGSDPTPSAVRARILATATPLGVESDRIDYGHGLLNAGAATAPGGPGAVTASRHSRSKPARG